MRAALAFFLLSLNRELQRGVLGIISIRFFVRFSFLAAFTTHSLLSYVVATERTEETRRTSPVSTGTLVRAMFTIVLFSIV